MKILASLRDRIGLLPSSTPPAVTQPSTSPVAPSRDAGSATIALSPDGPPSTEPSRPYWDGDTAAHLPPRAIFDEIYRRAGISPETFITAGEREQLRKIQKRIERLNKEIAKLDTENLFAAARRARMALSRGRGTAADAGFSRGSLMEARKGFKRQRNEIVRSAVPIMTAVAERVEQAAKKALPQFEADCERLGIPPVQSVVVRAIGLASWAPSICADQGILSPRGFLKQLGIKL